MEVGDVLVAYIRVIKSMYHGQDPIEDNGRRLWSLSSFDGIAQRICPYPILFALVMDELTRHIQGEMPWYMLFTDDIILIDEIGAVLTLGWRFGYRI